MTAVDVSGLRDLAASATPGPWQLDPNERGITDIRTGSLEVWVASAGDIDAAFIAGFGPETALRLLGVVADVERLCDECSAKTHEILAEAEMPEIWPGMVNAYSDAFNAIRDVLAALR